MPAIRHDDLLLRLVKEVVYIRSALRRVSSNLPLYDIASENTPAQLTADQNDYAPGNYDVLRMSSSTGVSVTGIRGGVKGRSITLINTGSYPIYLIDQSADSTAINRFDTDYNFPLWPKQSAKFYYNPTSLRWNLVSQTEEYTPWNIYEVGGVYSWRSICWSPELNLFCAVGHGATKYAMTSPDGINWTLHNAESGIVGWNSVCWSPDLGIFCAVGDNDDTMISSDGATWSYTHFPAGLTEDWSSVCWSPDLGIFCAVSRSGHSLTSPDGVNWTLNAIGTAYLNDVCWSPDLGIFCASSYYPIGVDTKIFTSINGTAWVAQTIPNGSWICSKIDWSPKLGLFCVSGGWGGSYNAIMTSPDGITWTERYSPLGGGTIVWADVLSSFYASGTIYYSVSRDGKYWNGYNSLTYNSWSEIAWSKELGVFCRICANVNGVLIGR